MAAPGPAAPSQRPTRHARPGRPRQAPLTALLLRRPAFSTRFPPLTRSGHFLQILVASLSSVFSPKAPAPAAGTHAPALSEHADAAWAQHASPRPRSSVSDTDGLAGAARQPLTARSHSSQRQLQLFSRFRQSRPHPGASSPRGSLRLGRVSPTLNKRPKGVPRPQERATFPTRLSRRKKTTSPSFRTRQRGKRGNDARDTGRDGFCSDRSLRDQRCD